MSHIVVHPTSTAQWHALIAEAEATCSQFLTETTESYLVFLLMRYVNNPEIVHSLVGIDFLETFHETGIVRQNSLRDVGDKCLLLAGLFPECAEKRQVQISYFVDLGRGAYQSLSLAEAHEASLYTNLANEFIPMMDILHNARVMGDALNCRI